MRYGGRRHHHASALPAVAAAAAAIVGDLEAGAAGQVAPSAGQDLDNHLQQWLFGPPGQDSQQIQQQYAQLLQSYGQHQSQGQITGHAAITLHDLGALPVPDSRRASLWVYRRAGRERFALAP